MKKYMIFLACISIYFFQQTFGMFNEDNTYGLPLFVITQSNNERMVNELNDDDMIFYKLSAEICENNIQVFDNLSEEQKKIINKRASITGRTLLLAATVKNRLEIVQKLLAAGADVNIADKYGATPLMAAVSEKRKTIFDTLIKVPTLQIDLADTHNYSALTFAIQNEDIYYIDQLLASKKVDLNRVSIKGESILDCAIGQYNEIIVKKLLVAGARTTNHFRGLVQDSLHYAKLVYKNRNASINKRITEKFSPSELKNKNRKIMELLSQKRIEELSPQKTLDAKRAKIIANLKKAEEEKLKKLKLEEEKQKSAKKEERLRLNQLEREKEEEMQRMFQERKLMEQEDTYLIAQREKFAQPMNDIALVDAQNSDKDKEIALANAAAQSKKRIEKAAKIAEIKKLKKQNKKKKSQNTSTASTVTIQPAATAQQKSTKQLELAAEEAEMARTRALIAQKIEQQEKEQLEKRKQQRLQEKQKEEEELAKAEKFSADFSAWLATVTQNPAQSNNTAAAQSK